MTFTYEIVNTETTNTVASFTSGREAWESYWQLSDKDQSRFSLLAFDEDGIVTTEVLPA